MKILFRLFCLAALCCVTTAAHADEPPAHRWQIRGRILAVEPQESSDLSINGHATVDGAIVPEVDFTYFLSKHWGLELIAAITPHDVGAKNTGLGNLDLGDVWLLPPTLTLQYHLMPDNQFRPYFGAGLNYTVFFDEEPGQVNDIDYDNGFGFAFQAGFDYGLNENWALNFDVKKLFLNTDVSINGGAVTGDVDIDPWIVGLGVSYRF